MHRPHRARNLRPPGAAEIAPAAITGLATAEIRRRRVLGEANKRVQAGVMKIIGLIQETPGQGPWTQFRHPTPGNLSVAGGRMAR
jgi:hypothetical protein